MLNLYNQKKLRAIKGLKEDTLIIKTILCPDLLNVMELNQSSDTLYIVVNVVFSGGRIT